MVPCSHNTTGDLYLAADEVQGTEKKDAARVQGATPKHKEGFGGSWGAI